MRVYELAKELDISSKEAMERLDELGVEVSNHFQGVDDDVADELRKAVAGGAAPEATENEPGEAPEKAAAAEEAEEDEGAEAAPAEEPEEEAEAEEAEVEEAEGEEEAEADEAEPEPRPKAPETPPRGTVTGPITIEDDITVKDLAVKMGVKPADVMRELMSRGTMANVNQTLEAEAAVVIADAFGIDARHLTPDEALLVDEREEVAEEDLRPRPPVVTIMGHVDHGKTLLLDTIRKTNVVAREAGGITQHIGASVVEHGGGKIVFIDTPGHEAFTRMRARGAEATDIVVLVVAADDGVMPQTVEAIDHAKAAAVPIIVAVNKMDLPAANPDRVKQQIADRGLNPEEWGGDTVTVEVSAETGDNIDELLEMIQLTAELQELRANPDTTARGIVLDAELDRRRGPVATLLVQQGTLRVGDSLVAGQESAKVRAMTSDRGESMKEAGPSIAVEILGLSGVPEAGDRFEVVEEKTKAREVAEMRQERQREESLAEGSRMTLEDLQERLLEGEKAELPVVVKADVQGSVEVLRDALNKLSTDQVELKIMHSAPGGITESDVLLASASDAIIIGFNVRPAKGVVDVAEREGVDLRLYTVIYQLIDDVKAAMVGQLEPEIREETLGRLEVRDTFRVPRAGTVAGCYVTDGKITRTARVRLVRDSRIVFEGRVGSLKRFKDDVREVQEGFECGVGIENFNDVKIGDLIEAYEVEEIEPTL